MFNRKAFMATAATALALGGSPAMAQDAGAEQEGASVGAENQGLGIIVVTARKRGRAEDLQDIALAASVISSEGLIAANVTNIADLGALVPNVSFQGSSVAGHANFSIRGMGVSGTSPQDEPTVGIVQDGIYWGSNTGSIGQTFDLAGVEVLRGPQGTLFGRNVTGGVVVITTNRPEWELNVHATGGLGNHGQVEASGVVNVPLIDDVLAMRVGGVRRSNNGFFTNGNTGQSLGEETNTVLRGSLLLQASDNFNMTFIGEYYGRRGDTRAIRGVAPSSIGAASLPAAAGYRTPTDYFTTMPEDEGYTNIDVWSATLEANLEVGPGTLTSVTGYRDVSNDGLSDYDGFPFPYFFTTGFYRQDQFSQELRYAADLAEFLSMTTGVYYFESSLDSSQGRQLNNAAVPLATRSQQEQNSWAIFGEADVRLADWLTVTVGGRYTEEEKTARTDPFGGSCVGFFEITGCAFSPDQSTRDSDFSPKIAVAIELSDDHLLYGSYTRGFRSGGFALRGVPLVSPYDAESVDAFEIGLKNTFFDNRVRLNVAAYRNKFDGLQRTVVAQDPVFGIVQSTFNAASATIQGFEIELVAQPFDGLELFASYGYVDATYDSFLGIANPTTLSFVRVPDDTFNVAATYTIELGNGATIAARASASYTGSYFYDDRNRLRQDSFTLVDASLTYRSADDRWSASLWGRNLTNTEYATWGSSLGALGENLFIGDPMTWGVRLSWNLQ